jgi:hypothetical protein
MAQEAPANSSLQSNEQSQGKAPRRRQPLDPLALTPRECFSITPFSLMRRMAEEMDRVVSGSALGGGNAGTFL